MKSTDLSEGSFRSMFGDEYALDAYKSGTTPDAFKHIIGSSVTDSRKQSIVQLHRTARETEQFDLIELEVREIEVQSEFDRTVRACRSAGSKARPSWEKRMPVRRSTAARSATS